MSDAAVTVIGYAVRIARAASMRRIQLSYITRTVNPQDVVALLKRNHGLETGDAVGRIQVEFEEQSGGRQSVELKLTYMLSTDEVNTLLGT